jgi:hypothetical protein
MKVPAKITSHVILAGKTTQEATHLEDKEYSNVYAIPANYTDSGKLFGGMVDTRNAVEAVLLLAAVGAPELFWIPMSGTIRVVVMTVTLIPLGVVAVMGVDGGSLFQYIGHILRFWSHRRKLHFRRIGHGRKKGKKVKAKKKGA